MQERFGSSWSNLEERRRGVGSNFMEEWEKVKRQFGSLGDEQPRELQLIMKGVDVGPQWYDEDEGMVKLTRDDVLKVFEPTIQEILEMIQQQNSAISRSGKKLDVSCPDFFLLYCRHEVNMNSAISPGWWIWRVRIPILEDQRMVQDQWRSSAVLPTILVSQRL
jgi:hypothetical protein